MAVLTMRQRWDAAGAAAAAVPGWCALGLGAASRGDPVEDVSQTPGDAAGRDPDGGRRLSRSNQAPPGRAAEVAHHGAEGLPADQSIVGVVHF